MEWVSIELDYNNNAENKESHLSAAKVVLKYNLHAFSEAWRLNDEAGVIAATRGK